MAHAKNAKVLVCVCVCVCPFCMNALFAVICVEILEKRGIRVHPSESTWKFRMWISFVESAHTYVVHQTENAICFFRSYAIYFHLYRHVVRWVFRWREKHVRFSEGSRDLDRIPPILIRDLSQLFIGHYGGVIELQRPIGDILHALLPMNISHLIKLCESIWIYNT